VIKPVIYLTTARQRFISSRLIDRDGLLGRVGARYVKAGFNVKLKPDHVKNVDLIAIKGSEKYCIKVVTGNKILNENDIVEFINTCRKINYKPVIILYGPNPRVEPSVKEKYSDLIVKRIRSGE